MTSDANKGISVAYNFLNLPTKVDFGSGDSIVWVYTVSGAKLRKTVYDNGTVQTTIDYVNGYQYKNGSLDFFAMEAGRVKKTVSGALRYEYNLTDHLGNTRVSFADTLGNGTAVILQEDHYYAFGLRIEGLSSTTKDNKFTYNGKELEDEHGLNWYHYGARYYDPQVGRWWAVDPKDEFHSAFTYVANNPIRKLDTDGKGGQDSNGDPFAPHSTAVDKTGFVIFRQTPSTFSMVVGDVVSPIISGSLAVPTGFGIAMEGSPTIVAIPVGIGLSLNGAWDVSRGFINIGNIMSNSPTIPGLGERLIGGDLGKSLDLTVSIATARPSNLISLNKPISMTGEWTSAFSTLKTAGELLNNALPIGATEQFHVPSSSADLFRPTVAEPISTSVRQ